MAKKKGPDVFKRPWGDDNYGADFDTVTPPKGMTPKTYFPGAVPPDQMVPMYVPLSEDLAWIAQQREGMEGKKPPKLDWNRLVEDGFTNEIGSPQEAAALEDLIKKAPIGTVYNFINAMDDDLRYGYLPPLTKLLRKRLKGTDLTLHEDFSLGFSKALGRATMDTLGLKSS